MPQSKAKIHFGDILMKVTNTPEMSTKTGAPLRGRIILGDAANALPVFTLEIDQLGNVVWDQSVTGIIGLEMTMQNLKMNVGMTSKIEALISSDYNSPIFNINSTAFTLTSDATATIKCPLIQIGSVASIEPLVLGNQLILALANFINTVFVANAATWGDFSGIPIQQHATVSAAAAAWLAAYCIPGPTNPYTSMKAFTEK
jgi:hypothetical protein